MLGPVGGVFGEGGGGEDERLVGGVEVLASLVRDAVVSRDARLGGKEHAGGLREHLVRTGAVKLARSPLKDVIVCMNPKSAVSFNSSSSKSSPGPFLLAATASSGAAAAGGEFRTLRNWLHEPLAAGGTAPPSVSFDMVIFRC